MYPGCRFLKKPEARSLGPSELGGTRGHSGDVLLVARLLAGVGSGWAGSGPGHCPLSTFLGLGAGRK